tara:strand:+ start:1328 stop:2284 length:957 start_codon:yes stop_codon:yes gene_type:complete
MIYNQASIKANPISASGYQIQLFVGYGEAGLEDDAGSTNLGFQSGSGRFFVQSPQFGITGVVFEGKNIMQQPTGVGFSLVEDFLDLQNKINLRCFFSGDLNGVSGLATRNIKFLSVFTGEDEFFTPDLISGTNLIHREEVSVNEDLSDVSLTITSEQIESKVEENIGYKVLAQDFLNFSADSQGVTGIMFSGFDDFPKIETSSVTISRDTINDIRFSNARVPVDIFNPCTIIIDSGIAKDFSAQFKARTNGLITITGINGASVVTDSNNGSTVIQKPVDSPDDTLFLGVKLEGIERSEFTISTLFNRDRQREAFLVSQ